MKFRDVLLIAVLIIVLASVILPQAIAAKHVKSYSWTETCVYTQPLLPEQASIIATEAAAAGKCNNPCGPSATDGNSWGLVSSVVGDQHGKYAGVNICLQ